MRILIVGAGAVGGYFGGRLLQAGADVTFLVRAKRQQLLAANGLSITSALGNFSAPAKTVLAEAITAPYDVVILSCKAYDLDGAIASFAPAMGDKSAVLPLLNGMRHLDILSERFGAGRVLGGLCAISATLGPDGGIFHLNDQAMLAFGEQDGSVSPRVEALKAVMEKAQFKSLASATIIQEMWEKWVFLSTLASATCSMRANVGEIMAATGGEAYMLGLYEEVRSVAAAAGHAQRPEPFAQAKGIITAPKSTLAASMQRDLEKGGPIEADHVIGDLLSRGAAAGLRLPLLSLAYTHLKAYEARRSLRPAS